MIISRTPLRLSFVGGGSDLAAFYHQHAGSVFSVTINKYIYINVNQSFNGRVRVAYSKVEDVDCFDEVEHPLVRGAAQLLGMDAGLEITSIADIPSSGSGLGSSSSFSVGLLNAMSVFGGRSYSKHELAEAACKLEIGICGQPIGKQDQFAASFGGFNLFKFLPDDSVIASKVFLSEEVEQNLRQHLMVFYTGKTRSASKLLADQSAGMREQVKFDMVKQMVDLVEPFINSLRANNIAQCAEILHQNWQLKKRLSGGISSTEIDDVYQRALASGALGGKLLGAGGSGFIVFLVPPELQYKVQVALKGLQRVYWGFDHLGASIIHS
jgi:D-glycero-alpha-D-manno-heptose-7-phosphate kinase